MKEVELSEAGNSFDALLDLIEPGEEVAIKRYGKVVAHLIRPPEPRTVVDPDDARAAMERIRARAKEAKLGPFDWEERKAYRDEGRR
jgi:antitoxin (DNA-binding transcriptional repressor) of toxin-antitoxin stability system